MPLRNWRGDIILQRLETSVERQMGRAVQMLAAETQRRLGPGGGARTGRQYRRPGSFRMYTASAPGQPPQYVTGTLQRSVRGRVVRRFGQIVGEIGVADSEAGRHLELGTSKMAPRPFLRPTIHENRGRILAHFKGIL